MSCNLPENVLGEMVDHFFLSSAAGAFLRRAMAFVPTVPPPPRDEIVARLENLLSQVDEPGTQATKPNPPLLEEEDFEILILLIQLWLQKDVAFVHLSQRYACPSVFFQWCLQALIASFADRERLCTF